MKIFKHLLTILRQRLSAIRAVTIILIHLILDESWRHNCYVDIGGANRRFRYPSIDMRDIRQTIIIFIVKQRMNTGNGLHT